VSSTGVEQWLTQSGGDHPLLDRTSVPQRVAGLLREMIMDGAVRPGDRLSDDDLSNRLPVSRNTIREAFRLLGHEGLLVHELNRGVFVRRLTPADVVDIYRFRQLVECAAIRHAQDAPPSSIENLATHLEEGQEAVDAERWRDVGTVNIRFHRGIARLLGSRRVDETMQRLLAELRLAFHVMDDDPRGLHGPYFPRNQQILRLLQDNELDTAEQQLGTYLADAEQQLITAYKRRW
jgi:DNA-binding GntR family transcriptional regulator